MITTSSPYNGGDKYSSSPSQSTTYTVFQNPDPPYRIPDGGIYYDRDPPIYKTNDTMMVTWDPPSNSVEAYPDPTKSINYNWYIDGNAFSCGTGTATMRTFNPSGTNCSK